MLGVKISHRYNTVAILSLPHRGDGKKQCPEQETGRDREGSRPPSARITERGWARPEGHEDEEIGLLFPRFPNTRGSG